MNFGFQNRWIELESFGDARDLVAFNGGVLLFKVLKYLHVFIPKMSLMVRVLEHSVIDLSLFCFFLMIVILAFANFFFTKLGGNIPRFYSFARSCQTLVRALFGDFDLEEIDANSVNLFNVYVFLVFLFVVVFILLSFFFAILGEAQNAVEGKMVQSFSYANGLGVLDVIWNNILLATQKTSEAAAEARKRLSKVCNSLRTRSSSTSTANDPATGPGANPPRGLLRSGTIAFHMIQTVDQTGKDQEAMTELSEFEMSKKTHGRMKTMDARMSNLETSVSAIAGGLHELVKKHAVEGEACDALQVLATLPAFKLTRKQSARSSRNSSVSSI